MCVCVCTMCNIVPILLSLNVYICPHMRIGLLNSSNESLFCYKDSENFNTFYDPDFIPVFNPSFDDPELEKQANEMCKGVPACLFDVAATGRLEIGTSALLAKEEEMTIANLSTPSK